MRALCEGCGKHQPPDWRAGDLCAFCGKSVRRDVRCYWCAKWVPAAKFCRSCGAAVVEEKLYGAARMLKDAGTDRFTIPKQLKEFDPDQIENFSRIYQRHSVAVARHVDEVRFLERFLYGRGWSAALEDELVPQLPWPEDRLAQMSAPTPKSGEDLAMVKAIHDTTPFGETKALAALVRLKLRDAETAFAAALVLGDIDRLQAALKGDDQQKSAAGTKLISLGVIKPVIAEIPRSAEELQQELVESLLRRKEAAPEAADALLEIV